MRKLSLRRMKSLVPWTQWSVRKIPVLKHYTIPFHPRLVVTLGALGVLEENSCSEAWSSGLYDSPAPGFLVAPGQSPRFQLTGLEDQCREFVPISFHMYLQPQRLTPSFGGRWMAASHGAELPGYCHTPRAYIIHNKDIAWSSFSKVLLNQSKHRKL